MEVVEEDIVEIQEILDQEIDDDIPRIDEDDIFLFMLDPDYFNPAEDDDDIEIIDISEEEAVTSTSSTSTKRRASDNRVSVIKKVRRDSD